MRDNETTRVAAAPAAEYKVKVSTSASCKVCKWSIFYTWASQDTSCFDQPVSQSVVKQIGAAPIFTRCGRATLTPVLEYLVTEPPLKSDGTPGYAAPAVVLIMTSHISCLWSGNIVDFGITWWLVPRAHTLVRLMRPCWP
jgi:hypothetical protein